MVELKIKSKISLNGYLKLSFFMTYRKPSIIFFNILGFFLLLAVFSGFAKGYDMSSAGAYASLIFGIVFVVVVPLSLYFGTKKSYRANKTFQEEIEFRFTEEKMFVKGETFEANLTLSTMYKMEELKNYILIYHNRQAMNIISKESMSKAQIKHFHELCDIWRRHKYDLTK